MIDCLIIGFNDTNFEDYVTLAKSMGSDSGAFNDLDLAFIEHEGRPYRALDALSHFANGNKQGNHYHNAEFMWPVVLYLGSYLTKRGFTFDYVNLFHLEKEKLKEKLAQDVLSVAITTTLYVSPAPILEIISFIKQHNEKVKIIVGGPYIDNQAKLASPKALQQVFKYIGADFYVISAEGEASLVKILEALKAGAGFDAIENIAYPQGRGFVLTKKAAESNSLAENMVDYTLFPREEFGEFVSLRTAKSCPFACSFCAFPDRAGAYQYLDVACVEAELNHIRDIGGITTLTFLDDTFNVPKARFKEILRMMIKNNYGFKWNSFYRSDQGDAEAIDLMAQAGCEGVFLGIESGSDTILKNMNKTAKRKHYLEAIPLLKQAGITAHGNIIIGFPGETTSTVQETIDFIEEAQPDYFRAQLWYADPTTPIWHRREEFGVKGSAFNWSHSTMDYQTACDWIGKMFVSITGSTWLPQFGFEDWSLYYLRRKGMSREQIKSFIHSFNAIIKNKVISPDDREAPPHLLNDLRSNCSF